MRILLQRLISSVCFLLLLLLPADCFAAAGDEPRAEIPSELRIPQGVLRIGDPVDNAIAMLGQPVYIALNQNYCWRSKIDLYGPELVVKALPDNKQIFGFYVRKWARGTTPEGIGVGSTKEAVVAMYGKGKEYRRKDIILSYGGDKPGARYLRFGISPKTNKVLYFWLGIPPKYGSKK